VTAFDEVYFINACLIGSTEEFYLSDLRLKSWAMNFGCVGDEWFTVYNVDFIAVNLCKT
jgi:hypothetical protein